MGGGVTFLEKGTIVRLRGILSCTLQVATTIGDGFFGAVGVAVVQTPAFTAGIASVPTPITEANSDVWLWHSFFDVRFAKADASDGSGLQRFDVDSKAMRIVEGAESTLFAVIEVVEQGAGDMDAFFDSRVLVKLG